LIPIEANIEGILIPCFERERFSLV